jgi:hypothetical protein
MLDDQQAPPNVRLRAAQIVLERLIPYREAAFLEQRIAAMYERAWAHAQGARPHAVGGRR